MIEHDFRFYIKNLGNDIPAGLVVFLVALPLCLGIALASGAPLFSGIITGIVGGVLVAWLSGSQLSVSGPAAGLTVIVLNAIEKLGGFEPFLCSLVLAGLLQLLMGYAKAGVIGAFFPSSVIKGMLAAIGLILIMKQIPHAVGYDQDYLGDESFRQADQETTFSAITQSLHAITPGAVLISSVSLLILLIWDLSFVKRNRILALIPGPLLAVAWGVGYNLLATAHRPDLAVQAKHLVSLPLLQGPGDFFRSFTLPDWHAFTNPAVYVTAATIAIIASLETLLSLEAVDKLDPLKRIAPTNRELKAQGIGNMVSGLIGGLPMTAVIVRSSANINAGGRTKVSCFVHGILLAVSAMFLANQINLIPLSCLAAVLLQVGYKLARPALFKDIYSKGLNQFLPFCITVVAILFTDLLKGMAIGIAVGLFFVVRANFRAAVSFTKDRKHCLLRFRKDASFLNKSLVRQYLDQVEPGSYLIVDTSRAQFIDYDIQETLADFAANAHADGIRVEFVKPLDIPIAAAAGH